MRIQSVRHFVTASPRHCVTVACLAVLATPCHAAEEVSTDGEKLLAYCAHAEADNTKTKINPFRAGFCMAFIEGALRGWEAHALVRNAPLNYCIPAGIKVGALVSTVTRYISENPTARAGKGEIAVIQAIQRAYPCRQK